MIFSFMTPGQIQRPPTMIMKDESADVRLFLDVGWTKTDTGYFKGYKLPGERKGNYTEITKIDTGWRVEFDDYRTQGIVSNFQSSLSNHPVHRETEIHSDNLPVDSDYSIENMQLVRHNHCMPKKAWNMEQDYTLDQCAHKISMFLKEYMENVLETIDKPIVLHFSGGLDTGVLLSIINKYNLPIEVKMDNQGKVLLNSNNDISPNFQHFVNSKSPFPGFAYKQIPLENKRWLVSGHYGGIEMLRFPQHVKSLFRHYDLDYNEELQKNVGSYLYNFLQCADHNCDETYPQYEFNDIVETKCHVLDAIKYNMEIQTIENNLLVLPWRQVEIPVAMLNLNINDFKEHVFHSTVHKKIIEMNDDKINNIIPTQKEKEIW
tara:strand:- start:3256 stop:4383 length:1128 start_codon:yes stop_codon:yes gene_type:complete